MNCPRCKTAIPPPPNPDGIVPCPSCGARLMTKAAALRSQGGPKRATPPPAAGTSPENHPPSATMPPTPAIRLGLDPRTRVGRRDGPSGATPAAEHDEGATPQPGASASEPAAPPAAAHVAPPSPVALSTEEAPTARGAGPPPVVASTPAVATEAVTLEALPAELVALRAVQEEILGLLRRGDAAPAAGGEAEEGPVLSPVRSRRRKSVIVVDDDHATRDAAVAALQQAAVPVRAVGDGHEALAAIAAEKPDVIAIEIGLAGEMGGKDVINMIKATMEWVDIPIVLWTREEIASQREARQIHGADELVQKASGPEALVANVITLFRRA
jgi:CheY-like chemotaxis protein